MAKKSKKLKFGDFDYSSIDDVANEEAGEVVVKVWCRVKDLKKPEMEMQSDGKFKSVSDATLMDSDGDTVKTTNLSKKWRKRLKRILKKGEPIEVLGTVEREEIKKNRFVNKIGIERIRSGATPTRIMQASKEELKHVEKFLQKLMKQAPKGGDRWDLLDAHKQAIAERHGIVGLNKDAAFEDSFESVIAQGYSGDMDDGYNSRIHNCFIGSSASGKKLLWEAAQDVNIASEESQPDRTSEAGITGTMIRSENRWEVEPKKIPRANKGVFGIQDFDKCKNKSTILSIFGSVMESGKCIISGAANTTLQAETGIHIDLNRQSDLFLKESLRKNTVEDTGLPTYIVSRFDNVVELKENAKLQGERGEDLLKNSGRKRIPSSAIGSYCEKHGLDTQRFQRLITAVVREQFREIDMRKVRSHMAMKWHDLYKKNKKQIEEVNAIAKYQMRLVHSVEKFVAAMTRIQLREVANKAAVDKAYHLISRKLDFLRKLHPYLKVPRYRESGVDAFKKWLYKVVGKGSFEPAKIVERYVSEGYPCGHVGERTILNWIKKVADKVQQKKWRIKKELLKELRKKD